MRPKHRRIGLLLLAVVLVAAALTAWAISHRSESPSVANRQHGGNLVERPTDPRFLPVWQFVNFVDGRQPAPKFAPHVTAVIDGRTHVLTDVQAGQQSAWKGSPFDLYKVAKGYTLKEGGHTTRATVDMYVDSGHDFACGGQELPTRFANTTSLWLGLLPPGPGPISKCTFLNFHVNHGTIDAVIARTSRHF